MSKRAHNGKTYDTCGGCGTMTTENETHDCETGKLVSLTANTQEVECPRCGERDPWLAWSCDEERADSNVDVWPVVDPYDEWSVDETVEREYQCRHCAALFGR